MICFLLFLGCMYKHRDQFKSETFAACSPLCSFCEGLEVEELVEELEIIEVEKKHTEQEVATTSTKKKQD